MTDNPPLDPVVELAEAIADYHVDHLGVPFDKSVRAVASTRDRGLSIEQLTAAIVHARELVNELGIMTFTTSSGTPCCLPTGGNDASRAHDARTAATLISPTDPDRPCPHEQFAAQVNVIRLTTTDDGPVTGYTAELTVHCGQCGERFRWIGVPAGLQPNRPCCSVDETELRAPLRPATSDPDFGLGIPGFAIQQVVRP